MEYQISDTAEAFTLHLRGRLTFSDHAAFRQLLDQSSLSRGKSLTIDLSRLDFIDSAGLGMLLMARDEAARNERPLIIQHPSGQVDKMFRVSEFDSFFTIVRAA